MNHIKQSFPSKVPMVAFALVVLHTVTACGKVPEVSNVSLSPAIEIASALSLTGKVTLTGGKPATQGQIIDVGQNSLCAGHSPIVNPTWKVANDGGLADVVISVRQTSRSLTQANLAPLVDQKGCEFQPFISVIQPGQKLRLHNSDMTFHNIRIVRHQIGTSGAGENLLNLAQPARGDENEYSFDEPGVYRLECDVHRWMRAWVYVHEGVHAVSTSSDGTYALTQALKDGDYEVSAWHPMFPHKLTKSVTLEQGRAVIDFSFDLTQSFNF